MSHLNFVGLLVLRECSNLKTQIYQDHHITLSKEFILNQYKNPKSHNGILFLNPYSISSAAINE